MPAGIAARVGADDDDEFTEVREAGMITKEGQAAARRTVDVLRRDLTAENSSLVEAGRHWLCTAIKLDLRPLIMVAAGDSDSD